MLRQQAMNRRMSSTNSSAQRFRSYPALGGGPNVRFGSLADIGTNRCHVRFAAKSRQCVGLGPSPALMLNGGCQSETISRTCTPLAGNSNEHRR